MTGSARENKSHLAVAEGERLHISYTKTDIKITDGPFYGTQLVDGLSSQKLGLNPRSGHAKFLLGKVTVGQILRIFRSSLPVSFHQFSLFVNSLMTDIYNLNN